MRDKTDFERGASTWRVEHVGPDTPYEDEPTVNHPEGYFVVGVSNDPGLYKCVISVEQTTTEQGHDITSELADHICAALNAYVPQRNATGRIVHGAAELRPAPSPYDAATGGTE